jgi:hypothetical protein
MHIIIWYNKFNIVSTKMTIYVVVTIARIKRVLGPRIFLIKKKFE